MSSKFEKLYCKRIINEAINETIEELFGKNFNPKDFLMREHKKSDAEIIIENLENGIQNVYELDEAKSKKSKKSSNKRATNKKSSNKKAEKEKDDKNIKVMKKQVLSMLNQDKFDMAAIAREVYPKMDDDARRSYVSRQARGKENIANDKVSSYYHALRSASKGRKNNNF